LCLIKDVGTITTNNKGNGNLHFTDEHVPGSTKFFVSVEILTGPPDFFASPSVELD
jgi:hypothetical protein